MIIEEFRKNTSRSPTKKHYRTYLRISCPCGEIHEREKRNYLKIKKNPLFVDDYCNKCWRSILNSTAEYKKKMSESITALHSSATGVELRRKISASLKGKNCGDKNAAKRPEVRRKISETLKVLRRTDEERDRFRKLTQRAWADGKYIGKNTTGRCIWRDFTDSSGIVHKVQGTYEYKFAEWLDLNNIRFKTHTGRIPYQNEGVDRYYYPDFWVGEWDSFVEIKSDYWWRVDKEKFRMIQASNPELKLKIFKNQDLKERGINLWKALK